MLPNFPIKKSSKLGRLLLDKEVNTYHQALSFIRDLPYGRNKERANLSLVLLENRGTCSSKHACLKQIADDHLQGEIELVIGIYRMNEFNTPGVGSVLREANLDYLPEAHCYLKFNDKSYDYTGIGGDFAKIKADLIEERSIQPFQVGSFKVDFHRKFITEWLKKESIAYDLEELWMIREACIEQLS